jgi:hypothetical protein
MTTKRRERGAGTARQLKSGRWQARFLGPDGEFRPAPATFDTKLDADAWLSRQARDVARGIWAPPEAKQKVGTVGEYAETWLAGRDLTPRTRLLYRGILDKAIIPPLGAVPLDRLSPTSVRTWYDALDKDKATARAHAYSLLRAILTTAASEDLIPANPCRVRGGGSAKKKHQTRTATLAGWTRSWRRSRRATGRWCCSRPGAACASAS